MKKRLTNLLLPALLLISCVLPILAADDHVAHIWLTNWGTTGAKEKAALYDTVRPNFPEIDKIEIYEPDNLDQKVLLSVTAGEKFEATQVTKSVNMTTLIEQGILRPIDDLLAQYGQHLLKAMPKEAWETAKYKGKTYFIPWNGIPVCHLWRFRLDVLKRVGMQMPKTYAELEKVMAAIKAKYPNDPVITFSRDPGDIAPQTDFVNPIGGAKSNWIRRPDGTVVPWWLTSYGKDVARLISGWVKKGYLSPDWATMSRGDQENLYYRGQAKIFIGWGYADAGWDAIMAAVPTAQLVCASVLAGPKGSLRGGANPWTWGPGFTTFGDKEAQVTLMKFYDWQATDFANNMLMCYGPSGMNADYKDIGDGKFLVSMIQYPLPDGTLAPRWGWNRHGLWWNEAQAARSIVEDEKTTLGHYKNLYRDESITTDNVYYDPFDLAGIVMDVPGIWEKYPNARKYRKLDNACAYWAVAGTNGDFEKEWAAYIKAATAANMNEIAQALKAQLIKTYGDDYATVMKKCTPIKK